MPDGDKTFSGPLVLDLKIWWRHVNTLNLKIPRSLWRMGLLIGGQSDREYYMARFREKIPFEIPGFSGAYDVMLRVRFKLTCQ